MDLLLDTTCLLQKYIFALNVTNLLHKFIKSLQNPQLGNFPFSSLKMFISCQPFSLHVYRDPYSFFLSKLSAEQANLMATCPVTIWVAQTKVQNNNYKQNGDKIILRATWTFYELHFISIIGCKKGFLVNYKVQNIDHRAGVMLNPVFLYVFQVFDY